jgi:Domain of unknown function (DUF222)
VAGAERYQVLVHVDAATLATDEHGASATGPGACALADGPGISPETARRLACDSSLVTLVERNGKPLSVGRRTRTTWSCSVATTTGLVHEGGFSVSVDDAGRRRFAGRDGTLIPESPSSRAAPHPLRGLAAGPLLTGSGEKMDLASCVDAVLVATGRGGFAQRDEPASRWPACAEARRTGAAPVARARHRRRRLRLYATAP